MRRKDERFRRGVTLGTDKSSGSLARRRRRPARSAKLRRRRAAAQEVPEAVVVAFLFEEIDEGVLDHGTLADALEEGEGFQALG